jgi:hypothetical protein
LYVATPSAPNPAHSGTETMMPASPALNIGITKHVNASPIAVRRGPDKPSSTPLDCMRPNRTSGGRSGVCVLIVDPSVVPVS